MLLFLAAAVAVSPLPVAPQQQARAVVRIMVPAELRFAQIERSNPRALRSITVRLPDRTEQQIRVVEFE